MNKAKEVQLCPLALGLSPAPLDTFPRFPEFPVEVRLLIWRAAIPLDFRIDPITIKPYSHDHRDSRQPPKTSRINRESRDETFKHFQRLELRQAEVQGSEDHRWLRRDLPTHLVLWNKETDVLALDWWALFTNVNDIISYLGLKPFVEEEKGTISCVQILAINTGCPPFPVESHLAETIEKKLSYFVGLREVWFATSFPHCTFVEERQLAGTFEHHFKNLAERNKEYSMPRICVMEKGDMSTRRILL